MARSEIATDRCANINNGLRDPNDLRGSLLCHKKRGKSDRRYSLSSVLRFKREKKKLTTTLELLHCTGGNSYEISTVRVEDPI